MNRSLGALLVAIAACAANAEPAAWRASHPDHPGVLLLLGSIHVLTASDHPLSDRVDILLAEADRVIFELDLGDERALRSELGAAAVLPRGVSLGPSLSPELYAAVGAELERHGLPSTSFDRYQPWFVAVSLTSLGMQGLGYRSDYGVERHVRSRAIAEGKAILGLESLTDQIDVFKTLTHDQQTLLIEQALAELERGQDTMNELVTAWERGELDRLRDVLTEGFEQFPGLYVRLVADRNEAWVKRLEALVRDDLRSLVVVGALHLIGEDSVIELLRQRGFAIEALRQHVDNR